MIYPRKCNMLVRQATDGTIRPSGQQNCILMLISGAFFFFFFASKLVSNTITQWPPASHSSIRPWLKVCELPWDSTNTNLCKEEQTIILLCKDSNYKPHNSAALFMNGVEWNCTKLTLSTFPNFEKQNTEIKIELKQNISTFETVVPVWFLMWNQLPIQQKGQYIYFLYNAS